jgi:MOSC domain-containing protein YiiM
MCHYALHASDHEGVVDPMTVVAIHLGAPQNPRLWTVESVKAVAGKGLEGDRHFDPTGAPPGGALTLVEEEIVEEVGLPPGGTRRQLTVRGERLNELIGKRFRVGEVECYGVALCEPCRHLEQLTRPGIIKDLAHRAGINADILTDGRISVGDKIVAMGPV